MKTKKSRLSILCTVAVAILAACQTLNATAPAAALPEPDAQCVVTEARFQQLYDRHCTATSGSNQLLPKYCTNAAAAQNFCRMVQNAPHKIRVLQPDGRVSYEASLGLVAGTAGETCGRLIIESPTDGTVVNGFPQSSGASGACK